MNNKGQSMFLAILTAIMIFAVGMMFLNHVPDDVVQLKSIGLDCTNPDISDGNKLACLGAGLVIPILFVSIIALVGGAIVARLTI